MEPRYSFAKTLFLYTQERFPLIPMALYSAAIFYLGYLFAGLFSPGVAFDVLKSIAGALTFFLLLFQLRILDEHKDYQKDLRAHPERMLSRGVITLKDLRRVLFPVIAIQFVLNLFLGFEQVIFWLIAFVWTLFMYKEFFVPVFLNRRQGLYLISHQLLVPIGLLYVFSHRIPLLISPISLWGFLFLFLLAVMALTITTEIARKTWSADREHEYADSYSKFWGIKYAVLWALVSAFVGGVILIFFYCWLNMSFIFPVLIGIFFLLFLAGELNFLKSPTRKNSKAVEGAGVIYVFACLLISIIGFGFVL